MKRLAIFDMDGLMFDTESLFSIVQREIASRRGKEFTTEIKRKMMGKKALEAISIMLEELGIDESVEDVFEEQNVRYLELLRNNSEAMPGLETLLGSLRDAGITIALGTSSRREWVDILFERFGVAGFFSTVVTGDMVSRGKPDPEIYEKVLKLSGTDAKDAVVLEDAVHGMHAGITAGCAVIVVPNEFTKDQDFSGAALVAPSLDDPAVLAFFGIQTLS